MPEPSGGAGVALALSMAALWGLYGASRAIWRYRELWKHLENDGENPLKMLHEYRAEKAGEDE